MKAEKLLERAKLQHEEGEKAELLKGLNALLIVTPESRTKARSYLEKAIEYIEQK